MMWRDGKQRNTSVALTVVHVDHRYPDHRGTDMQMTRYFADKKCNMYHASPPSQITRPWFYRVAAKLLSPRYVNVYLGQSATEADVVAEYIIP